MKIDLRQYFYYLKAQQDRDDCDSIRVFIDSMDNLLDYIPRQVDFLYPDIHKKYYEEYIYKRYPGKALLLIYQRGSPTPSCYVIEKNQAYSQESKTTPTRSQKS